MFEVVDAFGSFAVDDLDKAQEFYGKTLGLTVFKEEMGILSVRFDNHRVMIYPKPDYTPATFTVLNLIVEDIDGAVDELTTKGVKFEQYDTEYVKTDAKGIARSDGKNPEIAWFKDPAGNVLSVIQAQPGDEG